MFLNVQNLLYVCLSTLFYVQYWLRKKLNPIDYLRRHKREVFSRKREKIKNAFEQDVNWCEITATARSLSGRRFAFRKVEDGRFPGDEIYGTSHGIRLLLVAFYTCTQTSPHNVINSVHGRCEPKVAYRFGR